MSSDEHVGPQADLMNVKRKCKKTNSVKFCLLQMLQQEHPTKTLDQFASLFKVPPVIICK